MRRSILLAATAVLLAACASLPPRADPWSLQQQVEATERAFARTMADRDHAAFVSFLSDEAVFFSGDTPVRGKQAIAAAWRPLFVGPDAPFSWEPDRGEVLESGSLALSTDQVYDSTGEAAGTFNSVWRRETSGQWRIVFDSGSPGCTCSPTESR